MGRQHHRMFPTSRQSYRAPFQRMALSFPSPGRQLAVRHKISLSQGIDVDRTQTAAILQRPQAVRNPCLLLLPVIERAGGNAFYLEELIRSVAEAKAASATVMSSSGWWKATWSLAQSESKPAASADSAISL